MNAEKPKSKKQIKKELYKARKKEEREAREYQRQDREIASFWRNYEG